jgi:signal transduction histidine kinase
VNAHPAALAERRSIARDVHDGLAQELVFIADRARRLERRGEDAAIVSQIEAAAQRGLLEARLTIEALRAPEGEPFARLLARAVDAFQARYPVSVELDVPPALALDAERGTELLRIAGEAIANAVAHGGAAHVRVRLRAHSDGRLSLRVTDDGAGFDAATVPEGWGIAGMRERAALLGGRLHVHSHPGAGAVVGVTLP